MNINGLIGYTYMTKLDIKIILFADMHSIETECSNIYISDWIKKKIDSNWKFLLEEVPRTPETKLKELFPLAIHTNKLKELYLKDPIKIIGIDIRGELVNYALELIDEIKPNETLREYLSLLDIFFNLKHKTFIQNLKYYYKKENLTENNIAIHFNFIYSSYEKFILKYKSLYDENISNIVHSNPSFIEELDIICSNIMEWYTIMKIFEEINLGYKKFIIHCGLYHSSNIKKFLLEYYNFTQIDDQGVTEYKHIDLKKHTGCLNIPKEISQNNN
jgi:hypothetical protein